VCNVLQQRKNSALRTPQERSAFAPETKSLLWEQMIGGAGSQSERRLWRNFAINREKYRENRKIAPQSAAENAQITVFYRQLGQTPCA
jgi:hypothetical protein